MWLLLFVVVVDVHSRDVEAVETHHRRVRQRARTPGRWAKEATHNKGRESFGGAETRVCVCYIGLSLGSMRPNRLSTLKKQTDVLFREEKDGGGQIFRHILEE